MPPGTHDNVVTLGTQWWSPAQSTSLVTDAKKGTDSLRLTRNPGLEVGEIVVVDEITDPALSEWGKESPPGNASRAWFTRPDRPLGQVMEIAAIHGDTITFTTPFHIAFETAHQAQLTRFGESPEGPTVHAVKGAGLEDLYVSGGSQGQGNIWLSVAAYSWIKNVESDYQEGASMSLVASFRCVVRDSYFHSTQSPTPGGGGYGISIAWYSADNLVENNIVWNMNKVMVMKASGGGNVIGYNYMEDSWIKGQTGWVEVGLNASHMTCPHQELFEGNEAFNFDGDNTWGNAVNITVFRNHLSGKRRSASPLHLEDEQNRRAIGLMKGHMGYSFVGNVLGTLGQDPSPSHGFEYDASYPWTNDPASMWRLGYDPENWSAPPDPRVLSTVHRGGNFDFFTNEVHWEDIVPQPLPDSLYLAGKPAFFADKPWPWVDPTQAPRLQTLPAKARFDALVAAKAAR
jgi:hypothetical protein